MWVAWHLHVEVAQQSARDAVYDAKLDELRKTYPVGTPRLEIVKRLGQESTLIDVGEVEMFLGSYPGDGLVCAKWNVYAQFVFGNANRVDSEPLVRIQKRGIGACL